MPVKPPNNAVEGAAGGDDAQLPVEYQQRFTHSIDNGLRERPTVFERRKWCELADKRFECGRLGDAHNIRNP